MSGCIGAQALLTMAQYRIKFLAKGREKKQRKKRRDKVDMLVKKKYAE